MTQRLLEGVIPNPSRWRLNPVHGGATVIDLGLCPLNTTLVVIGADPVRVRGRKRVVDGAVDAVSDEQASVGLEFDDGTL